jgi:two-component system, chemotaxis family, chemotaxis protein CheY
MRILVVDDSPVARIALRGMLESEGFTVSEADDGDEIVGSIGSVAADLVLCDMVMPVCNGLQVIRELRRNLPDVKIIAMSGAHNEGKADMLQTAVYLGADEILYKPFDRATLVAAVRHVMIKEAVL